MRALEDDRVTTERLRGTVWARFELASVLYRTLLVFGRWLGELGVTANQLTVLSLLLAVASGVAIALGAPWMALSAIVVSGLFDALDGIVARATRSSSRGGALLDSVVDRVADAAPLTGIVVLVTHTERPTLALVPALAMVGGFTVSYIRARAEALGAVLPPLYARRAERVVVVAASIALSGWLGLDGWGLPALLAGVGLVAVASLFGAVHALIVARRLLTPTIRALPVALPRDEVPPSKRAA